MKVSIMITCYNCENCIDDAINSVVSQKMPFSWELLIGDDGSNDSTINHINRWIKKFPHNIKLFIMKRGPSEVKNGKRAAKNRANLLEHAIGEYLIFLDGDDQFLGEEKIKRQIEILDSANYQNCSCVAHNILANDITGGKKYPLTDIQFPNGMVDTIKYWKTLYFHTNTILFRECCKNMMLQEKYRDYLNDNFITYIILQYGQIYYLRDIWAQYNLTGNGLWTGKKRTYGCFRNMILFDMEKEINSGLKYASFVRHLYDFRYIFANYSKDDKENIQPLIADLTEPRFHYTLLMYNLQNNVSSKIKLEQAMLYFRVRLVSIVRHMVNIHGKLKMAIRH